MGPEEGKGKLHLPGPKPHNQQFLENQTQESMYRPISYTHKQQENALPEVFQSTHPSTVKHELSSFYYQQSTSLREMLMVSCFFFQVQRGRIHPKKINKQLHCQHVQLANHKYVVKSFSYGTKWSHPQGRLVRVLTMQLLCAMVYRLCGSETAL